MSFTLQVIPGYQLGETEPLTNAIANQLGKPTVLAAITDPLVEQSYWRNGNFYGTFWTTPSGVACPIGTETANAANWTVNPTGAPVTYLQSTTTPDVGSLYSLRITGAVGATDVRLSQALAPDISGVLRNGFVTVSGWVYNNTGGTVTPVLEVWSCNAPNTFTATTLQSSTSANSCAVGSWTNIVATFSLNVTNATNGIRVSIKIPNPALSAASYFMLFSRLQLQPGSVATTFEDDLSLFVTLPTITNANMGAASVDTVNLTSAVQSQFVPSGVIADFCGTNAPAGWLTCVGTAVSRTTYASLFNAITLQPTGSTGAGTPTITSVSSTAGIVAGMAISGSGVPIGAKISSVGPSTLTLTTNCTLTATGVQLVIAPYGIGDSFSTFNLPDFRGRVAIGAGQGTSLTNRILATTGGEETHILVTAELAVHNHTATQGTHTHTDSGHVHGMDHYHNIGAGQFNHAHADSGHTHPACQQINYSSISVGSGVQGPYQFLFTLNAGLTQYWSGNTGTGYAQIQAATLPAGNTVYASQTSSTFANTGSAVANISTVSAGAITVGNNGSNTAHNNVQPYLVATKIIKV